MTEQQGADPVLWIAPKVVRGAVEWPDACAARVTTKETLEYRNRARGGNFKCTDRAKVNFRGKLLCLRHAKIAALDELAGRQPTWETA